MAYNATNLPYIPSIVKELGLFPTDTSDQTEGFYYVNFIKGELFPRRGGNYSGASYAGLGYVLAIDERGGAGTPYGCRPRSL